jgi:BASS family bile acid:Na+ symporter
MDIFIKLIKNRNFILISALIIAFILPDAAKYTKDYTVYILALVMTFSTSGIKFKMLADYRSVLRISSQSVLLNYVIHGIILLVPAYFIFDEVVFNGFVVIAATPPGVAVIPFTYIFKGDLDYSFKGILGSYLISIFLSPLIIILFTGSIALNPMIIIFVIIKIIIVPMILSRFLLIKKIRPITEKIRGKIVDWGFALIIYTAVAINRNIILTEINLVFLSSVILFSAIILSGIVHYLLVKNKQISPINISKNLMLTVKSSGFAITVALILFESKASVPAAVMSILVLVWLIILNFMYSVQQEK